MATRCLIMRPVQVEERTAYQFIYCHSDGYPGWVGETLLSHYSDSETRQQLFELGGLSVLGKEIGEKHDFEWRSEFYRAGNYGGIGADPRNNWCRAYHRDRGDALQVGFCNTPDEVAKEWWADYVYIWENNTWAFYQVSSGKVTPYVEEVEEEEEEA